MWGRKLTMRVDKYESRSKWSEDDEEKLNGALEHIKGRCKEEAKNGVRQVSFPLVGPVLGFVLAERKTTSLQAEHIKHKIYSYFYLLGLEVRWSLEKARDLWVTEFPRRQNHVHIGRACDVWKATISW